jgi:phosphohistidine phosphatase SixA
MSLRTRLLATVMAAITLLSGCAGDSLIRPPSGTTTTLVMLRHAERPPWGSELTEQGRARAATLPAALRGIHLDAIYSANFSRNRDTVTPLAKQRGLPVKILKKSAAASFAARLVRDNPGKSVLWVGNTGNLKEIYADIGGEGAPPLNYGDLYIVRVPDKGPLQVTRSHYGR